MSMKYRVVPFFNGVSTFKTAFPDLLDALVEWREFRGPEDEKGSDVRKTGYRRGNFTHGMVPCSNPACHEGGYQLDRLVAYMQMLGETEREGVMLCSGRETNDEVRRGPVRCPHRIHYKVTLTQRTEPEKPQRERDGERERDRKPSGNQQRRRHRGPRRKSVA